MWGNKTKKNEHIKQQEQQKLTTTKGKKQTKIN